MSRSKFKNKKISNRLWIFLFIFAAIGGYILYQSFASPYNPYNPDNETGIATYYDNTVVGGPGYCAAIHYSRGKKLKVTNIKAGNELQNTSIICIVSDAGPFGAGRVIDLNTDDFKKLAGSTSLGVLSVKLELVTEPEPKPTPTLEINCEPIVSQKQQPSSVVNYCEIDQTAISVEPSDQQNTQEPQKNALERVFVFSKDIFNLILDIF